MKPQSPGPHVPADQPATAPCRIAFVGEAPGDDEVNPVTGPRRPLIGPSGRVFNAMLRTAGLDRGDCLITNVFSEQLPGNSVGRWCEGRAERDAWVKDVTDQSFLACSLPPIGREGYLRPEHTWHLTRLAEVLAEARPTVIVPMGGTALWALAGVAEIGSARGHTQVATRLAPGVKLLPTYHPAFVIKQWKWFTVGVGDFMKASREAEFPEVRHRKRRLLLEPNLRDLATYKADVLDKADYLSIDIETGWGQITCFGVGPGPEEAICCPFVDLRRPDRSYWRDPWKERQAWEWVEEVCGLPAPKLGQNFTYDTYWLLARMGIKMRNYREDTRLLHHALFPELPKDLGFMAAQYESVGPWKQMRRSGKGGTEKGDD